MSPVHLAVPLLPAVPLLVLALSTLTLPALAPALAHPALAAQDPVAAPETPLVAGETGFRLDLQDQHGEPVTYPLLAQRLEPDGTAPVVLVVWADRRGADGRQAWTEALRARYPEALDRRRLPGLVVLPVAHLPDVPGPLRALIRNRSFDDRPPTALDWDWTVADQLGFEPGVPNLAVLAPDGTLALRLSGKATEANRDTLFQVLDQRLGISPEDWLRRWPLTVWP